MFFLFSPSHPSVSIAFKRKTFLFFTLLEWRRIVSQHVCVTHTWRYIHMIPTLFQVEHVKAFTLTSSQLEVPIETGIMIYCTYRKQRDTTILLIKNALNGLNELQEICRCLTCRWKKNGHAKADIAFCSKTVIVWFIWGCTYMSSVKDLNSN